MKPDISNKWAIRVSSKEQAIKMADTKKKRNGSFFEDEDGFVVYWDSK